MRDTDWAYLGGIIDGEGCISASRQHAPRYHAQLKVVNCEVSLLDWIARRTGHGSVSLNRKAEGNSRAAYKWRVTGANNVAYILDGVLFYLVLKTDQAELAIELTTRPSQKRQKEIYEELKELHH